MFFKKTLLIIFCAASFSASSFAADSASLVLKGNEFYKSGRLDESIICYRNAIKADPRNFFAWMNCGYAYAAKGDNKTAIYYLEKAYSIQPEAELKKGIDMLKRIEKKDFFKTDSLFKFSRKIGMNISDIEHSYIFYDPKPGINGGLEVILGFGNLVSGQLGVFFTQKGAAESENSWIILDYLEFPAAVKLSFTPIKEILAGIYAGGSMAIKTAAKYKIDDTEYERTGTYNLLDFGLLGGIELTYPVLNIFFITADFRYTLGMSDIYANSIFEATNSVFTLYFGFIF